MSTIGELGALPVILSDSLLAKTPLWKREVRTVTPTDLFAFVALYRGSSKYFDAIAETNCVVGAGIAALDSGAIDRADFIRFVPPKAPFLLSDLYRFLRKLSPMRRRATLFALETKMAPRHVVELGWKDLRKGTMTILAAQIVDAMPRHIRLPYVFWDYLSNGSAGPLFGLSESILECSDGLGFEALLEMYERMILVDADANFEGFIKGINREVDERMSK